jgi:hypothetical protein
VWTTVSMSVAGGEKKDPEPAANTPKSSPNPHQTSEPSSPEPSEDHANPEATTPEQGCARQWWMAPSSCIGMA